jgi:hypothetical protein
MSLNQSDILLFPAKHFHFLCTCFSENEMLAQADFKPPVLLVRYIAFEDLKVDFGLCWVK